MDGTELEEAQRGALLTLFNRSPEDFAWQSPTCHQIETRRAQMHDQLIFDVLLSTGGIRHPDRLYPPRDVEALICLLDAIRDSTYDSLKKDCLVYYLIKFHRDGREDAFRDENCIPPQFVLLADAYWHLDNGIDVAKAVSILSDVRLNRDYTSKIFQAISLSDTANRLLLKYVRTAKPLLTEPMDIDLYVVALAESSLFDAWQYQRTFSEVHELRPRLVHKILEWCLTPQPRPAQPRPAQPRPGPLAQLLGFPFSNYEEALIHKYALHPPASLPPAAWPVIQDLVCVRLIQSGHYAAAIRLDRRFAARVIPGMTPTMQKAVQERRDMVDEVLATLPAVERGLVEADVEAEAAGGASNGDDLAVVPSPSVNGSATPFRATVSKDVPLPNPNPTMSISALSISARNDMPRFGGSGQANGTTFVPISTPISAPPQTHPFTSHLGLSSSQASRVPAPLLGSSGIKYPTPLFSQPRAKQPASSLFSVGGSANQTRNAFYTPPAAAANTTTTATNGVKRALGEDGARGAPNLADAPPMASVVDINMESDEERGRGYKREYEEDPEHEHEHEREQEQERVPRSNGAEELSYSVFSGGGGSSAPKQPPLKTRRVAKAEPRLQTQPQKAKMPPGAFHMDEDEPAPAEAEPHQSPSPPPPRSRRRTVSPAPPPPPTKSTRQSRAPAQKPAPDLTRSVPGAFLDDEDEGTGEEVEDYVAPLPASKRSAARKPRASRAGEDADEDAGQPRATRRSTRLSVASSVTSASPEPPSPKKATKGRKSTRAAGKK